MQGRKTLVGLACLGVIAIVIFSVAILNKGEDLYRNVSLFNADGKVTIDRKGKDISAVKDMKLKNGDTVEVGDDSFARLCLDDDKYVYLDSNTRIRLEASGSKSNSKTRLVLDKGQFIVEVAQKLSGDSSFDIVSPGTTMAIRGTIVAVSAENIYDPLNPGVHEVKAQNAVLEGRASVGIFTEEGAVFGSAGEGQGIIFNCTVSNDAVIDAPETPDESHSMDEVASMAASIGGEATSEIDLSVFAHLIENIKKYVGSDILSDRMMNAMEVTPAIVSHNTDPVQNSTANNDPADNTDKTQPTEEPTDAPAVTGEPTDAPEPTQIAVITPGPTQAPVSTPEPTKAPVTTPEPTKAPVVTSAPTQAPDDKQETTPEPVNDPEKNTDNTDNGNNDVPEITDIPADVTPEITMIPEPTDAPEPTSGPDENEKEPETTPEPTKEPEITKEPEVTRDPDPVITPPPAPTHDPEPTGSPEPTDSPIPTDSPEPTDGPKPTGGAPENDKDVAVIIYASIDSEASNGENKVLRIGEKLPVYPEKRPETVKQDGYGAEYHLESWYYYDTDVNGNQIKVEVTQVSKELAGKQLYSSWTLSQAEIKLKLKPAVGIGTTPGYDGIVYTSLGANTNATNHDIRINVTDDRNVQLPEGYVYVAAVSGGAIKNYTLYKITGYKLEGADPAAVADDISYPEYVALVKATETAGKPGRDIEITPVYVKAENIVDLRIITGGFDAPLNERYEARYLILTDNGFTIENNTELTGFEIRNEGLEYKQKIKLDYKAMNLFRKESGYTSYPLCWSVKEYDGNGNELSAGTVYKPSVAGTANTSAKYICIKPHYVNDAVTGVVINCDVASGSAITVAGSSTFEFDVDARVRTEATGYNNSFSGMFPGYGIGLYYGYPKDDTYAVSRFVVEYDPASDVIRRRAFVKKEDSGYGKCIGYTTRTLDDGSVVLILTYTLTGTENPQWWSWTGASINVEYDVEIIISQK